MDDFFDSIEKHTTENVINSSDLKLHKPARVDVRYDKKVTTVTNAQHITSYQVKQWPTLSDEEEYKTNALGISIDLIEKRRKIVAEQRREQEREAEKQALIEAAKIAEEEVEKEEDPSMVMGVSLEELDKIRADAYEEGKKQGHDDGYKEGLAQGLEEGKTQGFDQGLQDGTKQGYDKGIAQGREEGFVQGHNEGISSGQQVVLEQVERFRFLADCLANPLREVDKDVTDEIAYIISRMVKVITHKEVSANPEFLKSSIEKALSILPNAQKGATINLNPDDLAVIQASIGQDYIQSQKWILKSSDDLAVGDIKVENEQSEVNWRINDRIDELLEQFLSNIYPCVDSALREPLEGCPNYDEIPTKPLAPRNLDDIAPSLQERAQSKDTNSDATAAVEPVVEEDPAPYMDDYGHPVHVAPDGKMYYFDDAHQKVYVDENGQPVAEADAKPIEIPQAQG